MALAEPSEDVAPVAGGAAGEYSFNTDVNTLAIDNNSTGGDIFIKFNFEPGLPASITNYDLRLLNTDRYLGDVKRDFGIGRVKKFSIFFPGGSTVANIHLAGG